MQMLPILLPNVQKVFRSDTGQPMITITLAFPSTEDAKTYERYLEDNISNPAAYVNVHTQETT